MASIIAPPMRNALGTAGSTTPVGYAGGGTGGPPLPPNFFTGAPDNLTSQATPGGVAGPMTGAIPTQPGLQPGAPGAGAQQPAPFTAQDGLQGYKDMMGYTVGIPGQGYLDYQNSTGYRNSFDEGTRAIVGSAAARGLMHSGATAKALTKFGQAQATGGYENYLTRMGNYGTGYLNQLSNMNNTLGGTATAGQNALGQIATVGTSGGGNAASAIMTGAANQGAALQAAGNSMGNGIAGAAGSIGNAFANLGKGDSGGGFNLFG